MLGILLFVVGAALFLAPLNQSIVATKALTLFGYSSFLWGIGTIALSMKFLTKSKYFNSLKVLSGFFLLALSGTLLLTFFVPAEVLENSQDLSSYSGQFGYLLHSHLQSFLGSFLEFIIILLAILISASLTAGQDFERAIEFIFDKLPSIFTKIFHSSKDAEEPEINAVKDTSPTGETATRAEEKETEYVENPKKKSFFSMFKKKGENDDSDDIEIETATSYETVPHDVPTTTVVDDVQDPDTHKDVYTADEEDEIELVGPGSGSETSEDGTDDLFGTPQFPDWKLPPIELLTKPKRVEPDPAIHKRNSKLIENTLKSFGIETKANKVTIGPTVVQYAFSIAVGTKVSKVKNYTNDIALALATSENHIRIEAPIPGTSLIGIEMPNPTPNFVYLREMMNVLLVDKDDYEIPVTLGQTISGEPLITDLVSLPHLLVAGATGAGKSAGINSILSGILMTKSPDEVRMVLVDPKMVEMYPYEGIPHLLTPVITDMELVVNALQWAVEEMRRRYRLLKQVGVRNIKEYNDRMGYIALPYIVIVVDEMADLMLSTGVDVESKIVRLTQMARAIGIHMILATQRPSVDVITGLIKANIPSRMAFTVSTVTDSRVILDRPGAETLIGKGDMIYKAPQVGQPVRVQGAFTTTNDVNNIVRFIKEQTHGEVTYSDTITAPKNDGDSHSGGAAGAVSEDPLFADALEAVVNAQKASSSMLQRKFRIGYNRAARLMDELEAAGAIGPQEGSSSRKVLISDPAEILHGPEADE